MNQLKTARELEHYTLVAADGEIGNVHQYYYDAKTWAIRYLTVLPPAWPMDKYLLISPLAIGNVVDSEKIIHIELTSPQLMNSPAITSNRSLSRQFEEKYYDYYNWPPYWQIEAVHENAQSAQQNKTPPWHKTGEFNLDGTRLCPRNITDVMGFKIHATDGEVGYVMDVILDIRYWVIRYLDVVVYIGNHVKHVLLNPAWLDNVNQEKRIGNVNLESSKIFNAPEPDLKLPIAREYEERLFEYYGRHGYWVHHGAAANSH